MDDVLKIVCKEEVDSLTEHLNKVDPSNSIKFTYEEDQDGAVPFLDTLIMRNPDGSVLHLQEKDSHRSIFPIFLSPPPSPNTRCDQDPS